MLTWRWLGERLICTRSPSRRGNERSVSRTHDFLTSSEDVRGYRAVGRTIAFFRRAGTSATLNSRVQG